MIVKVEILNTRINIPFGFCYHNHFSAVNFRINLHSREKGGKITCARLLEGDVD